MASENPVPQLPQGLGKAILEPLNHAIAAGERQALTLGVQTHEVLEMLLNHLASVVAMIEPPGAREAAVRDVVGSFASLVKQHVERKHTSPAGLRLPKSRESYSLPEDAP